MATASPPGCIAGRPTTDSQGRYRGQTEPLAALVAVAAMCLAVSIYTGVFTSLIPTVQEDRDVRDGTLEAVWHDVTDTGVYHPTSRPGKPATLDQLSRDSVPSGYNVLVKITVIDRHGRVSTVAEGGFTDSGARASLEPPATAQRAERPITVRTAPGRLEHGTLRVVIWE